MSMYNLLGCSGNYSMTSGSLQSYYRDEVVEDAYENNEAGNYRINNNKATTSKDFDYMTKIKLKYLKYLSNSWKSHGLLLIN